MKHLMIVAAIGAALVVGPVTAQAATRGLPPAPTLQPAPRGYVYVRCVPRGELVPTWCLRRPPQP